MCGPDFCAMRLSQDIRRGPGSRGTEGAASRQPPGCQERERLKKNDKGRDGAMMPLR